MKTNVSLICACLLVTCACSKPANEETESPAPVQVTAVTQDTIRRTVSGDGVLFPRDQASVTPKIAAPVRKFYVNRGDSVKQGQLLADLENRDITAAAAEGRGPWRARPRPSIVKWIAEAHHGTVELASAPGTGTTFTVRLPLQDAPIQSVSASGR